MYIICSESILVCRLAGILSGGLVQQWTPKPPVKNAQDDQKKGVGRQSKNWIHPLVHYPTLSFAITPSHSLSPPSHSISPPSHSLSHPLIHYLHPFIHYATLPFTIPPTHSLSPPYHSLYLHTFSLASKSSAKSKKKGDVSQLQLDPEAGIPLKEAIEVSLSTYVVEMILIHTHTHTHIHVDMWI